MSSVSSLPLQIPNAQLNNHFSMSDQFTAGNGDDGDLEAVVRGFNSSFSSTCGSTNIMDYPQTCFSPLIVEQQDDLLLFSSFPDLFGSNTVLDEFEELYKPFYPTMLNQMISPQTSSLSSSVSGREREPEEGVHEKEAFPVSTTTVPAATLGVKSKRRKTQHKRVVVEVAAEGLSSDVWAWRKYGQKPIKGSPHPRSYYRCSSLKGCLARKQVERSQSDPQMFVITYTAEHCHGHPIRRSSLAGTTRHKFSSLPKSLTTTTTTNVSSSMSTDSGCSLSPPITPQVVMAIKEEEEGQLILEEEASKYDTTIGLDNKCDVMMLCDDLFLGFDELDRLTSDLWA